jgi:hypothetical protein
MLLRGPLLRHVNVWPQHSVAAFRVRSESEVLLTILIVLVVVAVGFYLFRGRLHA